jgi:CheY-like chemotaxis protein
MPAPPSRSEESVPVHPRKSGTVLLVDDEALVLDLGRRMLERIGFTVVTATDGIEAIRVYREQADSIDAIVLDLAMPRMDGEQTFHELKRIRSDARIIVSSGYAAKDVVERLSNHGLVAFAQKPYDMKTLAALVRKAMEPAHAD